MSGISDKSHYFTYFHIPHSQLNSSYPNDCDDSKVSEIGEKLYISRPNVTPLIDKLVKEGMAERTRDVTDKRIFNVKPTVKGKEFISNQKNMLAQNLKRRLSVMSDDTLDSLDASLVILKEILSKITS